MKIIFTDAWIGTQMSQKSIPGKRDTSISHRRTQETHSTQNQDSYKSQARLKKWIVRIKGMQPTLALLPPTVLSLPKAHTYRGDWGVVGGKWGERWLLGALWVDCRAGSRLWWVVGGPKAGPLHTGTHWKPIALHHFIKLLVYLFVLLLCVRREGERLLWVWALWIPVLFLVQSLGLFPTRGQERETEGKKEKEGG